MNGPSAGQVLYHLGQRYLVAGQWELAAQSLEQLVERYPDHPLSETALVWLIQYYASGEMGWQLRKQTRMVSQVAAAQVIQSQMAPGVRSAGHEQPVHEPMGVGMVQAGFDTRDATATASADNGRTERAGGPWDLPRSCRPAGRACLLSRACSSPFRWPFARRACRGRPSDFTTA